MILKGDFITLYMQPEDVLSAGVVPPRSHNDGFTLKVNYRTGSSEYLLFKKEDDALEQLMKLEEHDG